ncbi:DUF917 family protein [Bradyrhizobium genosp. P]|uniref:S-methyl thiohydantoin desulfurase domain-containing protein n=1 Tax=Bradyrhizobium genosp. P TaxID=83641 RepID=UPI003CE9BFEB
MTQADLQPALISGLFLSAGGSGTNSTLERHDVAGKLALELAPVELVSLDEFADDDILITSTSVGAPGYADPRLALRDYAEAANRLVSEIDRKPAGVMCGHVPGLNAWLVAATLGIPYVDAAANGRGHPTVEMGGMGLASRPNIAIIQVCSSGGKENGSPMTVVARGDILSTSSLMRQASIQNGGLVAAARGPMTASFVRANGAAGAITFQIELGHAMLAASGAQRVRATADFIKGEVLVVGKVVANDVAYTAGFDVGRITVRDDAGEVTLGVFNEFMLADRGGRRVATFPDHIGSLDPVTGNPVAISQLAVGSEVAIISAHRSGFPVGKGALDPAVFPKVEQALGVPLYSYLQQAFG